VAAPRAGLPVYGAQVHNFTRKTAKDPAAVRQAMVRGHKIVPAFGPRVTDVLKGMLRPALIPAPGNVLVVADWSAIEGRVNPWLSNCPAGEIKLNVFRSGLDPYKVNATSVFNATTYNNITAEQRQVGKVQELALGFLGGAGSFETFGRVYGVRMTKWEIARAINAWRTTNPWAMKHGQDLESAYTRAMRNKSGASSPLAAWCTSMTGSTCGMRSPLAGCYATRSPNWNRRACPISRPHGSPQPMRPSGPAPACGAVWRSRTSRKPLLTICCVWPCAASPRAWCCTA
jgi:hypothetical protein